MLRVTPAWRNVSARYGKPPTSGRIAIALWNAASRFSIALLIRSPFAREPLPPSAFHESAHPVTTTRPRRTGCSVNSRPAPQDPPTLCPLLFFRLQLANSSPSSPDLGNLGPHHPGLLTSGWDRGMCRAP